MSGVAAIISSLDPQEVWLYTPTQAQQLALEVRRVDTQNYDPFRDDGAVTGVVRRSTGLASVIHNRTVSRFILQFS